MTFRDEAVVFGHGAHNVGVVTSPTPELEGAPCVLWLNAGLLHHIGPQRMYVQIARRLAALGVRSLRFDVSGIGDSPPRRDRLPFREASVVETRGAMDFMTSRYGARSFVLAGLCAGADQAFQVALADDRVTGALLLDPYPYETPLFRVHRVARPLRRPETWRRAVRGDYRIVHRALIRMAGEHEAPIDAGLAVRHIPSREDAEAGFHALLDRDISLYVIFTAGQLGTYNHERQFWDMYKSLSPSERLRYTYFSHADHTMSLMTSREILIEHVERWFSERLLSQAASDA